MRDIKGGITVRRWKDESGGLPGLCRGWCNLLRLAFFYSVVNLSVSIGR